MIKFNRLLTEREGRTGEYWPEVVALRAGRGEVRTVATEDQYSTVRLEQVRLVSCLLYGIVSLTKCGQARTQGGFQFSHFSYC